MANNIFWLQGIITFILLWQQELTLAALADGSSTALTLQQQHAQQHTTNATLPTPTANGKVSSEVQIEGKMSHAGRLVIAAADEEDLGGRNAYVSSSQYGGGSISTDEVTPPPLYQLLQHQMEEVLAATGSDFKPFPMHHNKKYKLKDAEDIVAQVPPKKPLFTFHSDESDDYADETEGEADLEPENENGGYGIVPVLNGRPTPTITRRTSDPKQSIATGTTKIITNKSTTNAVQQTGMHDMTTGETSKNATSVLHKNKRRITFRTVSTSSQFVSTPLADLMLKFSIGIAKPSNLHGDQQDCNSSHLADSQPNTTEAPYATELPRNQSPIMHAAKYKPVKNRKPKIINF